ncbi:MAG: rhodanese-like domain-containing protein [Sandaracinaceae bacterium]
MRIRAHGILLAPVLALLAACGTESRPAPQAEPEPEVATAEGEAAEAQAAPAPGEVTPQDLHALLAQGEAVPVDANGESTRSSEGVVPGARLLTSSSRYDVDAELPSDRSTRLVFYCASEACGASHQAAERALEAGFERVDVMSAGIAGWRAAGYDTNPPNS